MCLRLHVNPDPPPGGRVGQGLLTVVKVVEGAEALRRALRMLNDQVCRMETVASWRGARLQSISSMCSEHRYRHVRLLGLPAIHRRVGVPVLRERSLIITMPRYFSVTVDELPAIFA